MLDPSIRSFHNHQDITAPDYLKVCSCRYSNNREETILRIEHQQKRGKHFTSKELSVLNIHSHKEAMALACEYARVHNIPFIYEQANWADPLDTDESLAEAEWRNDTNAPFDFIKLTDYPEHSVERHQFIQGTWQITEEQLFQNRKEAKAHAQNLLNSLGTEYLLEHYKERP